MSNVPSEQSQAPDSPSPDEALGASDPATPPGPNYLAFGIAAALVLLADIGSKIWAVLSLDPATSSQSTIVVFKNSLQFVLAYNRGGAWGLFHGAADHFRKPFFVIVSIVAILFILSLYRKVQPHQWALRWGLPLVLGGALGNLADRITRVGVVDFIDYRADWVMAMNQLIAKVAPGWSLTDHWPTFNVADIAICVGVIFMAFDVLFTRHHHGHDATQAPEPSTEVAKGPIG